VLCGRLIQPLGRVYRNSHPVAGNSAAKVLAPLCCGPRSGQVRTDQAALAQLVAHLICNQGVGGSSPSGGTNLFSELRDFQIDLGTL
jgi:hypothetical protein